MACTSNIRSQMSQDERVKFSHKLAGDVENWSWQGQSTTCVCDFVCRCSPDHVSSKVLEARLNIEIILHLSQWSHKVVDCKAPLFFFQTYSTIWLYLAFCARACGSLFSFP